MSWNYALEHWPRVSQSEPEKVLFATPSVTLASRQVKLMARRGIPPSIRGNVWKVISGASVLKAKNPGVYEVSLGLPARIFSFTHSQTHQMMLNKEANKEDWEAMSKDVNRTFPRYLY